MTDFTMSVDKHTRENGAFAFSDSGQYVTLGASNDASIAVPAGMTKVVIQVQHDATMLVDTTTITYSASTSFQAGTFDIVAAGIPLKRVVVGGTDTLYIHAITAGVLKISFYRN